VIPEVVEVLRDRRRGDERKFKIPDLCPVCDSKVIRPEGEAVARCSGKNCIGKLKERVRHFAQKDALNIEGLGDKIVEQLVDAGLVKKLHDLFSLEFDEVLALEGFAEKSAHKLLNAIELARTPELYRLIFGLGIRHVGETTAKLLAQHFKSLKKLRNAKIEDLLKIDGVGDEMAKSIEEYFSHEEVIEEIDLLLEKVKPVEPKASTYPQIFSGLTFVLTGTLLTIDRSEATKIIEDHGGKVSSSVSKKTSYVLAGEEAGSKLDKAKDLDVKILSEAEFRSLLQH